MRTRPSRLAERHSARVEVHDWAGYSAQRNYAAEIASHDWILAIDADERVPPDLAAEIQRILRDGATASGYRMPRVSYYLGRWIRGTDWYPDYQLRLYDRRAGQFNGKRVHESVELREGRPGTLQHDLQHYPYRDISDHVTSIDHYTTLAAEEWFAEGPPDEPARSRRASAGRVPAQLHRAPRLSRRHGRDSSSRSSTPTTSS